MVARSTRTRRSGGSTSKATATKAAILDLDFDDYDSSREGYMGDDPRPGVYGFRLSNVEAHTAQSSGNEGFRWTFLCTDPAYEGWRGIMYSDLNPDGSRWKTQQIVKALQGGEEKPLKLDISNDKAKQKFIDATEDVVGRVISDSYEDEDTGEVRSSAKLVRVVAESAAPSRKSRDEDDEDEDDFEDGDDDGFEDDEEGDEDDLDDDEDDEDEEDGEDDEEEEEVDEPEPAPRRRRPAAKSAPAKRTTAAKKAAPARRSRR